MWLAMPTSAQAGIGYPWIPPPYTLEPFVGKTTVEGAPQYGLIASPTSCVGTMDVRAIRQQ